MAQAEASVAKIEQELAAAQENLKELRQKAEARDEEARRVAALHCFMDHYLD